MVGGSGEPGCEGGGHPWELEIFEKFMSNLLPLSSSFVSKFWNFLEWASEIFSDIFLKYFQLSGLSVLSDSSGQEYICYLIPRVTPPSQTLWWKTLLGA